MHRIVMENCVLDRSKNGDQLQHFATSRDKVRFLGQRDPRNRHNQVVGSPEAKLYNIPGFRSESPWRQESGRESWTIQTSILPSHLLCDLSRR
jgi:hypothetical protein